jgi:hypothetical protein
MSHKIVLQTTLPDGFDERLEVIQKDLEHIDKLTNEVGKRLEDFGWELENYYKDLYKQTNHEIQSKAYELSNSDFASNIKKIRVEHAK